MRNRDVLDPRHWLYAGSFKQRVTVKTLQQILLQHKDVIKINGRTLYMQYRHLGVDVYEVWFDGKGGDRLYSKR